MNAWLTDIDYFIFGCLGAVEKVSGAIDGTKSVLNDKYITVLMNRRKILPNIWKPDDLN